MDVDRRTMLMGLIAGTGVLAGSDFTFAQEQPAPDPSLYIPKAHLVEDRTFLHDFMDEFAFVDLVTTTPTLRITHVPTVLDRSVGRYGTIFAHISAQNPQRATFDGSHTAVMVFRGPHSYISPSWYARQDVVPTWNFSVVHVTGRPKAISGDEATHALLARLIKKFDSRVAGSRYDFEKLPLDYVTNLAKGIAPFQMEIEAIEGKFKLGQERSEGDRQGVLAHLKAAEYSERSLYDVTEAFYRNGPK